MRTPVSFDGFDWMAEVTPTPQGYIVTDGRMSAYRLYFAAADKHRLLCIPGLNRCGYIDDEVTPYDVIGFGVENRADAATIAAAANLILKGVIV